MSQENVDRYALAARVHALLESELAAEGWQLLDVRVFRGGGRLQVRLYVDLASDERIDLDGCAEASRSASMHLEAADLFAGAWVLEVSSPGIRRPLRTADHFAAAVGQDVEMKWRPEAGGDARNLRGRLADVSDGMLQIEPARSQADPELPPVQVPVEAVLEANLDRDFDVQAVIREDRRQRKQAKRDERAARRNRQRRRSQRRGGRGAGKASDTDERDG